jgi:hypothetical protein
MSVRSAPPVGGSDIQSRHSPLAILVVGTHDWAVEQSIEALEASGYRALRCHEPGEPPFPCNALIEGRTCPLDVGFDAVLTVRARPLATPTPGEMGVVCALHANVPLVVGGIVERNPFDAFAARVVDQRSDLVEAVTAVAAGPHPQSHVEDAVLDVREEPVTWRR